MWGFLATIPSPIPIHVALVAVPVDLMLVCTVRFLFIVVLLGMVGCAQGGNGRGGNDGGVRLDSSTTDVGRLGDAGRPDTRPPDMGPACEQMHPDSCEAAEAVTMAPGGTPMLINGFLPRLSTADWFAISFPPMSTVNMQGMGMPSLALEGDDTMILDIRTSCTSTLPTSCGEGSAREATSYSFVDDQAMMGEAEDGSDHYTTRDSDWPATLYVRVARKSGPAGCTPYTLTVSR